MRLIRVGEQRTKNDAFFGEETNKQFVPGKERSGSLWRREKEREPVNKREPRLFREIYTEREIKKVHRDSKRQKKKNTKKREKRE